MNKDILKTIIKSLTIPFILIIVSAYALFAGQAELTKPQEITYGQQTKTKAPVVSNVKVADVSMKDLINARAKVSKLMSDHMVGQLIIPSQNINLPMYNVADNETLSTGVAQYYTNRPLFHGNTVLAAHNYGGADVLIHRAKYLKPGDKIYIVYGNDVYLYSTESVKVINMHQTQVLYNTKEDILTLLRCDGGWGTPDRLAVRASLADKQVLTRQQKIAWNIKDNEKPSAKRLGFVATGLAISYAHNTLNWRILLIIVIDILAILIALYLFNRTFDKNRVK